MSQQRLPALTLTPWNIAFQQHTVQCTILLSCILFYNVSASEGYGVLLQGSAVAGNKVAPYGVFC
jgi:hypothetical protein